MNDSNKQTQNPEQILESEKPDDIADNLEPDSGPGNGQTDRAEQTFAEDSREQLMERLNSANQEIQELKDGFMRARADVENIQRRSHNEMVAARKFAIEGFAQELLTVLDSLDQASRVELDDSNSLAVEKMKEGLELTLRQMEKVMDKFGVVPVEADTGTKFNPELHQAISMIDGGEIESGHIVSVMQKGYLLKERLLRPAMVVIAS